MPDGPANHLTPPPVGPPGRLLGVDVGSVRVGVALSDPGRTLATPLTTLRRSPGDDGDLAAVLALVREHAATGVVVGLPRHLDGREGDSARTARSWACGLHDCCVRAGLDVAVVLVDERLTTVDAHRRLHEAGIPGRRHRSRVDQGAAVLILQNALDTRSSGDHRIPAGERIGEHRPSQPDADVEAREAAHPAPRKPRHRRLRGTVPPDEAGTPMERPPS